MTHGMLLGKFLPPTQGHAYLVDFATAAGNLWCALATSYPEFMAGRQLILKRKPVDATPLADLNTNMKDLAA